MRQRLSIARALITKPRVIFLDEPTKGLDPTSTRKIHKLIREHLVDQLGITILLTSHQLPEIEALCDRIAIMDKGRIQAFGTMTELRSLLGPVEKYRLETKGLTPEACQLIASRESGLSWRQLDNAYHQFEFANSHDDDQLGDLLAHIQNTGGQIRYLSCEPISLTTIFEHLTNEEARGNLALEQNRPSDIPLHHNPSAKGLTSEASNFNKPVTSTDTNDAQKQKKGLKRWLSTAWAFIQRDMRSETSYRFSFSLQIVEIALTVTVLFFLSRLMGQDVVGKYLERYGGNYFAFAIIGVAFFGYFNVGLSSHVQSLREAQTTGTLEAMLATPTDLSTIILCSSMWSYIMSTIRVLAFLVAGFFLMESGMTQGNYALACLIMLLTIISASSLGVLSASFIMVLKRGDPITWLFRSASFLLGGVLFPVTVLPKWMEMLSLLLPTTHALRAMRLTLLKGASMAEILPEFLALVCFCLFLLPFSLVAFRYAVKRAKIDGSLTHY
jgi:ABC-2 type transport system permease protein